MSSIYVFGTKYVLSSILLSTTEFRYLLRFFEATIWFAIITAFDM